MVRNDIPNKADIIEKEADHDWFVAFMHRCIVSGFRTCGIYPLNATMIPHHAFVKQNPETIPNNDNLEKDVNDDIPTDADNINNVLTDNLNNGVSVTNDVAVVSKTNNPSF